jgi:hypothetical protein
MNRFAALCSMVTSGVKVLATVHCEILGAVTGRQGRRGRRILDDLKKRRGYSHLKEEALDRTMWKACFGRGFGPVVRQTTK